MYQVIEPFVAAAVQRAPAVLDCEATTERAVDAVGEAAGGGARLVVFPETWLPTYPYWHPLQSEPLAFANLYRRLFENSVVVPGPETARIGEAAARAGTTVVIGVSASLPKNSRPGSGCLQ